MVLNGLPLCDKCHRLAHTKTGEIKIMKTLGEKKYNKLMKLELVTFKQYLSDNKMTEREFMDRAAAELKSIIGGDR